MSTRQTRWVRVDRSSSSLEFDGSSGLESGGTFNNSLKFVFSGSEVIVWIRTLPNKAEDDRTPPPFNCTIDGVAANFALNANKWRYSWEGEETGNLRTLEFNRAGDRQVTMSPIIIWYLPSPSSPPLRKGSWAEYPHADPALVYKGTWRPHTENGNIGTGATKTGSSLELSFTGSRIWWEGRGLESDVPSEFRSSSLAFFNIDGGESRPFFPFIENSGTYNPGLLQHIVVPLVPEELPSGPHVLTLVTNADTSLPDPPVVLFTLLIEQGSFLVDERPQETTTIRSSAPRTTNLPVAEGTQTSASARPRDAGFATIIDASFSASSSFTSSSPTASPTPSESSLAATASRVASIGGIVGGAVGGTAALILLIIGFLWARGRRAKQHQSASHDQNPQSFLRYQPHPSYSSNTADQSGNGNLSMTTSSASQPLYRKGQLPLTAGYHASPGDLSRDSGTESSPTFQYQDSGARLRWESGGLPPAYTRE